MKKRRKHGLTCTCWCDCPNKNYKKKNGWKCKDIYEFDNVSKQGKTHCRLKKEFEAEE